MPTLNYNKLWKKLIDMNINKTKLHEITGISQSTISKLSKGENVNTDVLVKICNSLNCNISEIVDINLSENQNGK